MISEYRERRARVRRARVMALRVRWGKEALASNVDPDDVQAIRESLIQFARDHRVTKRDLIAMMTLGDRTV